MKVTDLKFSPGPFVMSPTWTAVVSQQTHHTYSALTGKRLLNLEHKNIRNNVLFWGEREAPVWWGWGPISTWWFNKLLSPRRGEARAGPESVTPLCRLQTNPSYTETVTSPAPTALFPPDLIRGFQIHPCL